MLTESVLERLEWFQSSLYQVSGTQVVIRETKEQGEADVHCQVRSLVISFNGLDGKNFLCLNNLHCADGIIFENYREDRWKLHILELKGTMAKKLWKKVKEQFEGALLNAHAIMGILGIEKVDEVKCYTAFKKDWYNPNRTPDPVSLRAPLGENLESHAYVEWQSGQFSILSLQEVEHIKITIDPETKEGFIEFS